MALENSLSMFEHKNHNAGTECVNCSYYYQGYCFCFNEYMSYYELMSDECERYESSDLVQENEHNTVSGKYR